MSSNVSVRKTVAGLVKSHRYSPKAIISTIFGDMIVPHGGSIWLGSLVEAGGLFDIGDSHARTSILRLSYEGWLNSVRVGKLSYYNMTEESMRDYHTPVYGAANDTWNGDWHLLFTSAAGLSKPQYVKVRQALIWEGVGQLAPHVFVSLSPDDHRVSRILEEFDLKDRVQVLNARAVEGKDPDLLRRLVRDAWLIGEIEERYNEFLKRFRPINLVLERNKDALDDESCFVIRILLILAYRLIAVRDPHLPASLLPATWSGHTALALCKSIYEQVLLGSEAFIRNNFSTLDGPLQPAGEMLWSRFGGLSAKLRQAVV